MMTLGEKISELRKQRGWTQDLFGEKVGIHGRHISRWERNLTRPSIKTLKRVSEVLKIDLDELLDADKPTPDLYVEDAELAERIRQLKDLAPAEKTLVYQILDLIMTQKQMEQVLSGRKPA